MQRARVLILDDESTFAGLIAEILGDRGFDPVVAKNAQDALDKAADGSIPVAVVDLVMPDMGGLELAERLRAMSPDTQVIILTGQGDMGSAVESIHLGVFDFLDKASLDLNRLERSVREGTERCRLTQRNRELVDQLQESNRLLTALHEIGASLTGEVHVDRVLERVVVAAKQLTGAATGRVILFGKTHAQELLVETAAGDGADAIVGARLQAGEGIATLTSERDEVIAVPEAADHPRFSHRCDEMPTSQAGWICAPLRHGVVTGALILAGRPWKPFGPGDASVLGILARQTAVGIDNALAHERAINFFTHISDILVLCLERIDYLGPGHARRVAALTDMLTRRMGMNDIERRHTHFAALLHDIGKIMLDPSALTQEACDSEQGRQMMQQHPALGAELLRPVTVWEDILPVIHGHHERWDGSGYPARLAGEEIPLGARIVAVAEAFDTMTREVTYAVRRTPNAALAELEACAGTQFDPRLVRLFVAEYRLHQDQLP